jgi:predicted component of type VI protein secretion system
MKVNLVVASGVHQGKVIPVTGPQFLIGRDPQCQLRPASQAISKRHCGVLVRDGTVYIRDYNSTNGTVVNDEQIKDKEVAVTDGASLKLGPLDFTIRIEVPAPNPDGTPLPTPTPEAAAALAAVKATTAGAARTPPRDATPDPAARPAKPASGSKEAPALKTPATRPVTDSSPAAVDTTTDDDHDKIAAILLGMDEDGNHDVPEGSTVMDMPSPPGAEGMSEATGAAKGSDKGKQQVAQTREEMSSAAQDLLRKYMRRPK